MRTVRMTAKKAGTCTACAKPILIGQSIYWARGQGARHTDCTTAGYQADQCSTCKGAGVLWNNVPCRQCDGTGSAKVAEFARQGGHPRKDNPDPMGVDLAYEDDCARRCGP